MWEVGITAGPITLVGEAKEVPSPSEMGATWKTEGNSQGFYLSEERRCAGLEDILKDLPKQIKRLPFFFFFFLQTLGQPSPLQQGGWFLTATEKCNEDPEGRT